VQRDCKACQSERSEALAERSQGINRFELGSDVAEGQLIPRLRPFGQRPFGTSLGMTKFAVERRRNPKSDEE